MSTKKSEIEITGDWSEKQKKEIENIFGAKLKSSWHFHFRSPIIFHKRWIGKKVEEEK